MDTTEVNLQAYKTAQIRFLPDAAGVYALCDLDDVPIYIGKAAATRDTSIRKRVQRHLTSARSDIVANRQLDVWEIAHVWAWSVPQPTDRTLLESQLFHYFDAKQGLINGTVPPVAKPLEEVPEAIRVQVLPTSVIELRQDPSVRFPRQVQQFHQLLDYILNTQDKRHLRRALQVHHARMSAYLTQFLRTHEPRADDDDHEDDDRE